MDDLSAGPIPPIREVEDFTDSELHRVGARKRRAQPPSKQDSGGEQADDDEPPHQVDTSA